MSSFRNKMFSSRISISTTNKNQLLTKSIHLEPNSQKKEELLDMSNSFMNKSLNKSINQNKSNSKIPNPVITVTNHNGVIIQHVENKVDKSKVLTTTNQNNNSMMEQKKIQINNNKSTVNQNNSRYQSNLTSRNVKSNQSTLKSKTGTKTNLNNKESNQQKYDKMCSATGLGAKIKSTKAVQKILDFLNLGEVLKIRLLQKGSKEFSKVYLEQRLEKVKSILAPIPIQRIEQISELRRSLKETTNKMIAQNSEDLVHIIRFRYPSSIIIKIFKMLYFLKCKEEISGEREWERMLDKLLEGGRDVQLLIDYLNNGIDWDLDELNEKQQNILDEYLYDRRLATNNVQMISNIFGCAFRKIRLIMNIKDANYHLGIDLGPILKEHDLLQAILSSRFQELNQTILQHSFINSVSPNKSLLKY